MDRMPIGGFPATFVNKVSTREQRFFLLKLLSYVRNT